MTKAIVIGLDGTTFRVIKPMLEKLPNFRKLMKDGSYGTLKTILPAVSTTSWTSFCTGKTPAKHGIFDFYRRARESYDIEVNNARDIKSKRFWELINKKSIVVNVPLSYPNNDEKNIVLTGLFTPEDKLYAREDVVKEIKKNVGEYLIDVSHLDINGDKDIYEKINMVTDRRAEVCKFLMKNYDWDMFFVVFTSSDRLQHSFFGHKDKLEAYYKKLDKILGELTKDFDGYVFVVSDHGFCERKGLVYLNSWLNQIGFLEKKNSGDSSGAFANWDDIKDVKKKTKLKSVFRFIGVDKNKLRNVFRYLNLTKFQRYIPKKFKNILPDYNMVIDWEKTKAYTRLNNNLCLNVKNRDPKGVISLEEYDKVCDEIRDSLKNLKDEFGDNIIGEVYRKDEIYSGPYLEDLPDILFTLKGYKNNTNFSKKITFFEKNGKGGIHDSEGIFICKGFGIKKGEDLGKLSILDVAPTLLHIFDSKIPVDMDGEVIGNMFENGSKFGKIEFEDKTKAEMDRIKDVVKGL